MTLNMKSPYEVENEKLSKLMRDAGGDKVFEALPMSRIAWLLTIHKRPDLNYNLLEFGRGQVSLTRLIHVCLRLIRRVYFQVTSAITSALLAGKGGKTCYFLVGKGGKTCYFLVGKGGKNLYFSLELSDNINKIHIVGVWSLCYIEN